ncbi:hypothetical protein A3Q56_01787 [Intoshia linei]|uniref:C2H2-type domain-containing protein n=1 Tax=Intoshia linei TaxID=1819745 RepID=A0A177B8H6_9BILA|nr:hypothetical protein A3Q56_01787 [Intoshia linei]
MDKDIFQLKRIDYEKKIRGYKQEKIHTKHLACAVIKSIDMALTSKWFVCYQCTFFCNFETCANDSSDTKNAILVHLREHLNIKIFKCPLCDTSFNLFDNFRVHFTFHLNNTRNYIPVLANIVVLLKKYFKFQIFSTNLNENDIPNYAPYVEWAVYYDIFDTLVTFYQTRTNINLDLFKYIKTFQELATDFKDSHQVLNEIKRNIENLNQNLKDESLGINSNLIKCSECKFLFTKERLLRSHMISVHIVSEDIFCPLCPSEFDQPYEFAKHLLKFHHFVTKSEKYGHNFILNSQKNLRKDLNKPLCNFTCSFCDQRFLKISDFRTHVKIHEITKKKLKPRKCNRNKDKSNYKFTCEICSSKFQKLSLLTRHERIHTGEKPFKCTKCERAFSQSNALKAHLYSFIHNEKGQYVCPLCPQNFTQLQYLRQHVKNVHESIKLKKPKVYKCQSCTKTFDVKDKLWEHNRGEHSKRFFPIPVMTKSQDTQEKKVLSFYQSLNIKFTKRVIDNRFYFECPVCEQIFLHNYALKRHFIKHTGLKPYTCRVCSVSFVYKYQRDLHFYTHFPNKCLKCCIAFASCDELTSHVKDNHDLEKFKNRVYTCPVCMNETFNEEKNMIEHIDEAHSHFLHVDDDLDQIFNDLLTGTFYKKKIYVDTNFIESNDINITLVGDSAQIGNVSNDSNDSNFLNESTLSNCVSNSNLNSMQVYKPNVTFPTVYMGSKSNKLKNMRNNNMWMEPLKYPLLFKTNHVSKKDVNTFCVNCNLNNNFISFNGNIANSISQYCSPDANTLPVVFVPQVNKYKFVIPPNVKINQNVNCTSSDSNAVICQENDTIMNWDTFVYKDGINNSESDLNLNSKVKFESSVKESSIEDVDNFFQTSENLDTYVLKKNDNLNEFSKLNFQSENQDSIDNDLIYPSLPLELDCNVIDESLDLNVDCTKNTFSTLPSPSQIRIESFSPNAFDEDLHTTYLQPDSLSEFGGNVVTDDSSCVNRSDMFDFNQDKFHFIHNSPNESNFKSSFKLLVDNESINFIQDIKTTPDVNRRYKDLFKNKDKSINNKFYEMKSPGCVLTKFDSNRSNFKDGLDQFTFNYMATPNYEPNVQAFNVADNSYDI